MRERDPSDVAPADGGSRVISVEPVDARGLRVRVALDDGSALELAAEVTLAARLGAGALLPAGARARLLEGDERWRAREAALACLARRPHGRDELRRRLTRAGFRAQVIAACLDGLEAQQLLDDGAFARSFVRDRLRLRPRGKRRLGQELREKGVARETVESAVAAVFAEQQVDEATLARAAALKWLGQQKPADRSALAGAGGPAERQRVVRRLMAFLARRGFSGESCGAAVGAAREAARAAPRPPGAAEEETS